MADCQSIPGLDPKYCVNVDSGGYTPMLAELDTRVTGLESGLIGLDRDVKHIGTTLDDYIKESRQRDDGLRREVRESSNRTRPTTQAVIMAIIGIIAAGATWSGLLVGGIWTLDTMSIEPLKRDIAYINAQLVTHEDDNHPYTVLTEVASLRAKVESNEQMSGGEHKALDTKIQILERELRDQIALTTQDRWTRTDEKDQWEVENRLRDNQIKELHAQVEVLRERLIKNEDEDAQHIKDSVQMERELSAGMVRKDELQLLIGAIERERIHASEN